MFVTALRKNLAAESLRHFGIENPLLLEQREGIGRKYLGPLVPIVNRSISAGKNMTESRRHRGSINHRQDLRRSHRRPFKQFDIALERLVDRMPCHVVERIRDLTDVEIGRLIVLRCDDLGNQVGRNRFSGLVIHGPQVEELFLGRPILHDLRRQLNEILIYVRTADRLVLSLRKNGVQRVSELMQESFEFTESKQ